MINMDYFDCIDYLSSISGKCIVCGNKLKKVNDIYYEGSLLFYCEENSKYDYAFGSATHLEITISKRHILLYISLDELKSKLSFIYESKESNPVNSIVVLNGSNIYNFSTLEIEYNILELIKDKTKQEIVERIENIILFS